MNYQREKRFPYELTKMVKKNEAIQQQNYDEYFNCFDACSKPKCRWG